MSKFDGMFGLSNQDIFLLRGIFAKYPLVHIVKIYGSRAKGNYHTRSDIDLVIIEKDEIKIPQSTVYDILSKLEESSIIYKIDLQIYNNINNIELKEHIDRIGQIFYTKDIQTIQIHSNRDNPIFDKKDIENINKIRNTFIIAKQKYFILEYINKPTIYSQVRNLLCESLFRNIILEIYAILYDTDNRTIANKTLNKLTKHIKNNEVVFQFVSQISYDNSTDIDTHHENLYVSFNGSSDAAANSHCNININITDTRNKFKKYRDKVLAHKDNGQYDYHFSQNDIKNLLDESEKIIYLLYKVSQPTTSVCFDFERTILKPLKFECDNFFNTK